MIAHNKDKEIIICSVRDGCWGTKLPLEVLRVVELFFDHEVI